MCFPLQASIQVVLGSVWVPVSPVVWFFQCVFLMCDAFPFASIDSGCFGFRVGPSLSSSLIFPVRFLDVWCAFLCKHHFSHKLSQQPSPISKRTRVRIVICCACYFQGTRALSGITCQLSSPFFSQHDWDITAWLIRKNVAKQRQSNKFKLQE